MEKKRRKFRNKWLKYLYSVFFFPDSDDYEPTIVTTILVSIGTLMIIGWLIILGLWGIGDIFGAFFLEKGISLVSIFIGTVKLSVAIGTFFGVDYYFTNTDSH